MALGNCAHSNVVPGDILFSPHLVVHSRIDCSGGVLLERCS